MISENVDNNQNIDIHQQSIYLIAESENEMKDIDENGIYIIGGFVDHKLHKGVCHQKCQEMNFRTERLPIQTYVNTAKNTVLASNHVFDILCRMKATHQWKESLEQSIPKRYLN